MKEKVDAGYTRLHISPFDSQLFNIIVPAAVRPNARRISYHSIQTFPDKLYGFIDLPVADAAKIKSKLNGATLRGAKISIDPARPDNMPISAPDAIVPAAVEGAPKLKKSSSDKKAKKDKKRKRDKLEMPGVELEEGRKVKRGWTVTSDESQAKKKKAKDEDRKHGKPKTKDDEKKQKKRRHQEPESKYIDGPEALVKTRLPPNKTDSLGTATGGDKKRSKKGNSRDVVVHEFENNTKFATFLRTTQPKPATGREGASFVEGKGWVDKDGTVLEEVKSTRPTAVPKLLVGKTAAHAQASDDDDTTSSSGSSSGEDDSEAELSAASPARQQLKKNPGNPLAVDTTLAGSVIESDSARPRSSGSMRSLTIKIPPATPTPGSSKVHPLEALYKRQLPGKADEAVINQALADSTPFTFGGGLDDDLEDEKDHEKEVDVMEDSQSQFQGSQLPMTPYSKQDFEWRNTRSAAPTPDTAHPSRMSRLWPIGGDDDLEDVQEDDQEEAEGDVAGGKGVLGEGDGGGEAAIDPNTDFQSWFWQNRGDLNRSWKKRRKEAAKAKRYRENKAKQDRAI